MLSVPSAVRIFVAREPTDLRKGFDGLSGLVQGKIDEDPQSGHLFLFFNRRRDRAKILGWTGTGFFIFYKRLERGRFALRDQAQGSKHAFEINGSDMTMILEGIDLRGARRRAALDQVTRSSA